MENSYKYNWVNALRGYAILLVILIHCSQSFIVSEFGKKFYGNGSLGVQLFFILSSFTLFNSYSSRILTEKEFLNRDFFIRRFFRIAPYYYFAGLIYVFYKMVIKHNEISIENLIANFTFTNGIYLPGINDIPPGGWSIGIEMLFYLMVPVLFKYINNLKRAFLLFMGSMIISIIINHYFLQDTIIFLNSIFGKINYNEALYHWLPNQFPVFVLGIIVFHINKNIVFSFKWGEIMVIASVLFYIVFSFLDFGAYGYYFIKREYVYGLIFVLFAIGTYTTDNKFIVNNFVQKVGIVSFSMYLNHFLIISILGYIFRATCNKINIIFHLPERILQNDFIFICFYLLIITTTYSISKLTYKYMEIKGINFGNKIINKLG